MRTLYASCLKEFYGPHHLNWICFFKHACKEIILTLLTFSMFTHETQINIALALIGPCTIVKCGVVLVNSLLIDAEFMCMPRYHVFNA